jgi:hypothetical protein
MESDPECSLSNNERVLTLPNWQTQSLRSLRQIMKVNTP